MPRPAPSRTAATALALGLVLAAAACTPGPGAPRPRTPAEDAVAKGRSGLVGNSGNTLIGLDGGSLIGLDGGSVVKVDGQTLIGLDGGSLIGQDGGSLVGNNGNSVIGQNGGNLVGNSGNTLIGQDGGSLKGSVRVPAGLVAAGAGSMVAAGAGNMRLQALGERPLAGVHVYLRHVDGRFFVDRDGKLISAVTDAQGGYAFPRYRAGRGLVVFVPSSKAGAEIRGLSAVRAKDQGAGVEVGLASSLTTSWIYAKALAGQKDPGAALDRLPATLEAEARARALGAIGDRLPAGLQALARDAFAAELERRRAADAPLAATLDKVLKVITEAGSDGTKGGAALAVALQRPNDVAVAPDGSLYVAELLSGVVRRVAPDGTTSIVLGPGSPTEATLGTLQPSDLAVGPDGTLYVGSSLTNTVLRVAPDGGQPKVVAGGGAEEPRTGLLGTAARLATPSALAIEPDGALAIGEDPGPGNAARLLRLRPDGTLEVLPPAAASPDVPARDTCALSIGADGTWWALVPVEAALLRKPPGGAWQVVANDLVLNAHSDVLARPDGSAVVSIGVDGIGRGTHALLAFDADGRRTVFAGRDEGGAANGPAAAATFFAPAGLAARADGTVVVTDRGNGLVRAIAPDGMVSDAVGVRPAATLPLDAPLNGPGGLAFGPDGQLVMTEYAANTIRRLEPDGLRLIAGGAAGFAGLDGSPVPGDRLYGPAGIAFGPDGLYVAEGGNRVLRRLRPDGRLELVAGGGQQPVLRAPATPPAARAVKLGDLMGVAVGPDGRPYFAERDFSGRQLDRIWRVAADGRLEHVAGAFEGNVDPERREGQRATAHGLGRVTGMAFDAAGDLFVAEVSTAQILKIDKGGLVTTVAGVGGGLTAARVFSGEAAAEGEGPATAATLIFPTGLGFDAAGNLYVAELGTRFGQAFTFAIPFGGDGAGVPVLDGRIRVIKDGRIRTLAGLGAPGGGGRVRNPLAMAVSPAGKVYFVDNGSSQLKSLE